MAINLSRIKRIEKRLQKRNETQSTKLKVPTDWEDFAALCTIRSGGKMVKFEPYSYQVLLSKLMDLYSNIVVIKSRQLGITQTATSKFLHRACINPAYSAMSFMRNAEDASALSRRVRQMLGGLSEYVDPANDNVGYLKLAGLGEMYFKNSSKEGSRSYDSVQDFLFDESAFSENIESIYAASSPSSAMAGDDTTKLIVSTPSAKSGWYWNKLSENNGDIDIEEACKAVAAGELFKDMLGAYWFVDEVGTVKLILHWRCHPIYSQKSDYLAYRKQQDGSDDEVVLREYDLRFIDSAVSVFSSNLIKQAAEGSWEDSPSKDAVYYIGIDTATTGGDYCCAIVLKESSKGYSVVKLYRKRQETSDYHLYQIANLIEKFKPETIGIEVTGGVGQVYLEALVKQFKDRKFEAIRTTSSSKPAMISALQLALEKAVLKIPPESVIVEEILSFRRQGKRLEASPGKHDDTVMALAFALTVSQFNQNERSIIKNIEVVNPYDFERIISPEYK
jgi:Terminase RNaseH-like domain